MTEEDINEKAEKHCNEVLCNAHEKCNEVIKCRDWRSRRAGFYCGYEQAIKELQIPCESCHLSLPQDLIMGSNTFFLNKVELYRTKHDMTDPEQKVISMDCALLGWHACIDWLKSHGVDVHKAFSEE